MPFHNPFRRRFSLNQVQDLTLSNHNDLEAAQIVLEAARRVQKRFSVTTDAESLNAALATARSRDDFALAFQTAGIHVIDTSDALRYRVMRLKPSIFERFKGWNRVIYNFLEEMLLHGGFGKVSAWVGLLLSMPLALCGAIDALWYDVHFLKSWPLIVLPQVVMLIIISSTIYENRSEKASDEFDRKVGRLYASLNGVVIGFPVLLLANVLGIWFYQGPGKRSWTVKSLKQHDRPLSNGVVLAIDQILQTVPKARIELEVLEPHVGYEAELFVTLPLGGTGERIYLWHEAA